MSTISAGTTSTNALVNTGDTTGNLVFQTNGTTTAMTIDTSQNVGIGTSSPGARLAIVGTSGNAQFQAGTTNAVFINAFDSNPIYMTASVTNSTAFGFGAASNIPLFFMTNNTERMRIDTSGNVGIGTSSPRGCLDVNGGGAAAQRNWAYITAGNVGNQNPTSLPNGIAFGSNWSNGNSESNLLWGQATGSQQYFSILKWNGTSITEQARFTSANEFWIANQADQGAYNLQVGGTGVWGAGAYVNGSDARIKDNVAPLQSGLDTVAKLNPVTFQYKESWSKDTSTQPGFIAQELQTALADTNYVDGVVKQGEEYMSVSYQTLIPVLTKAIQELKAQNDDLRARVAALEGAQ